MYINTGRVFVTFFYNTLFVYRVLATYALNVNLSEFKKFFYTLD